MKTLTIALCLLSFSALAQQTPPAANQIQFTCIDVNSLPADLSETHIMFDNDNDRWMLLTVVNSGKQMIGFVPKRSNKFCVLAEGKIAPKS